MKLTIANPKWSFKNKVKPFLFFISAGKKEWQISNVSLYITIKFWTHLLKDFFQSQKRMWKWKKRHVIQMVFFTLKRFWFQQSLKTCRSPNHHLQVTVGLLNIFFCHWWFIHPDKIDRLWANRCVKKVINGCRNSRRG